MKLQTCVAVTVASVLVLCVLVSANNITWGQIGPYDYLIARDYVIHDANWFTKHKEVVNYPPKGHQNFRRLSAVRVWDYGGPKNFGYVTLLKGGPGFTNSSVEVRSQTRRALNMTIEYFSRY